MFIIQNKKHKKNYKNKLNNFNGFKIKIFLL